MAAAAGLHRQKLLATHEQALTAGKPSSPERITDLFWGVVCVHFLLCLCGPWKSGQNEGQVSALRQTRGHCQPDGASRLWHQATAPCQTPPAAPFHCVHGLELGTLGRGFFLGCIDENVMSFSSLWPFTPILVEPTEKLGRKFCRITTSAWSAPETQCY